MKFRIYNYPKWLQVLYPGSIWGYYKPKTKVVYFTFDDGPSTASTDWILEQLKSYNAKATFFCVGNQVVNLPDLFRKLKDAGHTVGNHSMTHPRGFKTKNEIYINDVKAAAKQIKSSFFRAPYGSLKFSQHRALKKAGFTTVFWSYVTYDFEKNIPIPKIIAKMKRKVRSGDIIVFHDSEKAFPQLKLILPTALEYFYSKGYTFDSLDNT